MKRIILVVAAAALSAAVASPAAAAEQTVTFKSGDGDGLRACSSRRKARGRSRP